MNIRKIPMMKIRQHRGGLAEAMETMQEIPATLEAIRAYAKAAYLDSFPLSDSELASFQVQPPQGPDKRIGWDNTCLITWQPKDEKGRWVFGMCSSEVVDQEVNHAHA